MDSEVTCLSGGGCEGSSVRGTVGAMRLFCGEQRIKREQRAKKAKASYFDRK